jgi:hypothetical protein
MLSAIITALLVCVMLSIIVSLMFSVVRAHKRRVRVSSAQTLPTNARITIVLPMLNIAETSHKFRIPSFWYSHRRTLLSGAFLIMVVFTLFVQSGLADGAFRRISQGIRSLNVPQHLAGFDVNTALPPLPPIPFSASAHVVRVDSADRSQYYSDYQWHVWSYSSCSGISMEMVINAYGYQYIAADFLQKELNLGVWGVYSGLVGGEKSIAQTAAYFGFRALPNPPRNLQDLIYTANKGFPVIVGIPGHIMVVRGGDGTYVYLADSSPANRTALTHAQFTWIWNTNFSVVLVPR